MRANTRGASVPCASPEPGVTSSGHPKATSPATLTSATAMADRGRSRRARSPRGRVRVMSPPP